MDYEKDVLKNFIKENETLLSKLKKIEVLFFSSAALLLLSIIGIAQAAVFASALLFVPIITTVIGSALTVVGANLLKQFYKKNKIERKELIKAVKEAKEFLTKLNIDENEKVETTDKMKLDLKLEKPSEKLKNTGATKEKDKVNSKTLEL